MAKTESTSSGGPALIAAQEVLVGAQSQRIALPGAAGAALSSPGSMTVEPIRNGDVIVGVEVVCTCGQRVRIAFDRGPG